MHTPTEKFAIGDLLPDVKEKRVHVALPPPAPTAPPVVAEGEMQVDAGAGIVAEDGPAASRQRVGPSGHELWLTSLGLSTVEVQSKDGNCVFESVKVGLSWVLEKPPDSIACVRKTVCARLSFSSDIFSQLWNGLSAGAKPLLLWQAYVDEMGLDKNRGGEFELLAAHAVYKVQFIVVTPDNTLYQIWWLRYKYLMVVLQPCWARPLRASQTSL